jgi:hypothetical protein
MHTRLLRPVLLALGALLLSARPAAAQFIELLTEAPVTLQVSLTTTATTTTATERRTVTTTTRLTQAQIIDELRANSPGFPASPSTGWILVAVRSAPADLVFIDGSFHLYAVNGNQRYRIPTSKLQSPDNYEGNFVGKAFKYKEKYLGQYIINSRGTATSHIMLDYRPSFTVGATRFNLVTCATDGFANITFQSRDAADGYEVFFYALNSLRATTRGSFTGTAQIGNTSAPTEGLITITLNIGAPKLVNAALYPEVDYFPYNLE